MKVTRERYKNNITVREIKIKVRKSVILADSMIKTSRGGKFRKNCVMQMLMLGTSREPRYVA